MKVKTEIIIDADREYVWRVIARADNLSRWQPTLVLTEKREPNFMAGIYESPWSRAIVVYHFERHDENSTQLVVYANHHFKGLKRLLYIFVRQAILNRTEEDLQRCKLLIETAAAENAE